MAKKPDRKQVRRGKAKARRSLSARTKRRRAGLVARAARRKATSPLGAGLFTQSVIHVLGRNPGRAICGAELPGAPANPVHELWAVHGDPGERTKALAAVLESLPRAVATFQGSAQPCAGCVANVTKAKEAAPKAAKAGRAE